MWKVVLVAGAVMGLGGCHPRPPGPPLPANGLDISIVRSGPRVEGGPLPGIHLELSIGGAGSPLREPPFGHAIDASDLAERVTRGGRDPHVFIYPESPGHVTASRIGAALAVIDEAFEKVKGSGVRLRVELVIERKPSP